jgi:glycosyltransferase involved in cell wall biosynthesis
MSSLSIAHVSNMIGGGMGTVFRVLFPAQARRGDNVALFVRHASEEDVAYFASAGVEVHSVTSLVSLARQLRAYDVVHLHSADLGLLAAGWLSHRATIFTLHGLRAQTRLAGTVSLRRLPTWGGLRRRLKRMGLSFLLRRGMTRVTTVSQFLAEKAEKLYRVDLAKVTVVYNGIALDQFRGGAPDRNGTGATVGWMGRLVPVKRVDVLLRAVASVISQGSCPALRVILVGDGELKDDLTLLARSLDIGEIVEFVGHSEAPQTYLTQMDLFAFPSRDEGAALAVNEAMASGLPALVMEDGGGVVELVQRSGAGVVVPDEAALADAIVDLLKNGKLRADMAERGMAYASRELDPLDWAGRFDEVYRTAISP